MRRKQSNRESARRSRLRKQAECELLAIKVTDLEKENTTLRIANGHLQEQVKSLLAQVGAMNPAAGLAKPDHSQPAWMVQTGNCWRPPCPCGGKAAGPAVIPCCSQHTWQLRLRLTRSGACQLMWATRPLLLKADWSFLAHLKGSQGSSLPLGKSTGSCCHGCSCCWQTYDCLQLRSCHQRLLVDCCCCSPG